MVRNDLFIQIPNFFKCPISLDVMKSPVSLCTGVTYDRSSIQRWLEDGNTTCPATMQVLQSKDFVPNHTLHRLIKTWSETTTLVSSPEGKGRGRVMAMHELRELMGNVGKLSNENWKRVLEFAEVSEENRVAFATLAKSDDIVTAMVNLVSDEETEVVVLQYAVNVLEVVAGECREDELAKNKSFFSAEFLASFVRLLRKGKLQARISAAKVLKMLTRNPEHQESKLVVAEANGVLFELFRLVGEADSTAVEAGLASLISLAMVRRTRLKLVRFGAAVELLGKILLKDNMSVAVVENVLKLLEMIANSTEGRAAICNDKQCVGALVEKMLKVSKTATEHAAVILWSVCYLGRDEKAHEAVIKSMGLTKILVLLQSDYSPAIRQMCTDMIKVFRVNSKSCLSGYDTKTTHIMPF